MKRTRKVFNTISVYTASPLGRSTVWVDPGGEMEKKCEEERRREER